MEWLDVMEKVAGSSESLSTLALASGGTAVLAIISTSYHRPKSLLQRLPYLCFIPGWVFFALSIYSAHQIERSYLAALHVDPSLHSSIAMEINDVYADQMSYFLYGISFFSAWLLLFTAIWIFGEVKNE